MTKLRFLSLSRTLPPTPQYRKGQRYIKYRELYTLQATALPSSRCGPAQTHCPQWGESASWPAANPLSCPQHVGQLAVSPANATPWRSDPWKPAKVRLTQSTNLSVSAGQELGRVAVNQCEGANRRAAQVLRIPRLQEKAFELRPGQRN